MFQFGTQSFGQKASKQFVEMMAAAAIDDDGDDDDYDSDQPRNQRK